MALPRTPSQTVGPYLHIGLIGNVGNIGPELVAPGTPGALTIAGQLLDGEGAPVPDGMVELWEPEAGRARSATVDEGRFEFVTLKPGSLPWPGGGEQAPHINVAVFARGLLKALLTRVYFPDEVEANDADPVLSELEPVLRETLIATPDGDGRLRFDIRLQGERQTVFFAI